ncbi:PIN domain-containing protein [Mycobacteroides abscessus]|uniref:PIN domain-containing protein n=1 Tax=Mycobacteroides abscessus TaxID=36809 RepID=UPI0009A62702|nr:PIN domain-containing protein [Mycobacteroides abscessus]MDO2968693.1 PIN domain-containing protein [Mycobacteroides abscessus subsp. bolletii]MDO3078699.1 PIN domain-containing protein [Mycobacteroides abscessus subsp. bolletii]SLC56757.1 Predicted ATPase related to phosphate starvation-inducible protein PhoH [Mycobacteroides abscessus subsp. bolletii]
MNSPTPTYAQNLVAELDAITTSYADILGLSAVEYVNPNNSYSDIVFLGAADWGWVKSDNELQASRMALLRRVRDWIPRFRLLFPHPTPEVATCLDTNTAHLERWLVRDGGWDHSVPSTIEKAQESIRATATDLGGLVALLPTDEYGIRLVVDTNALIDNPDLAAYTNELGNRYMAHLMPVVLREIDDLKRAGKSQELRENAKRAERRLKGIRNNGDVLKGVCVSGDVIAKFEHAEPRSDNLPHWLDMTVPDDRLVASALLLQSEHAGSALYVATSDINLQTKLAAVGLPFVEPPAA